MSERTIFLAVFDFDDRVLRHCDWSPDRQRIVFGNSTQSRFSPKSDIVVRIHDVSTGELLIEVLGDTLSAPRRTQRNTVVFGPDGRQITIRTLDPPEPADENAKVELLDSLTGTNVLTVTIGFARVGLSPILAFSADGHRLVNFENQ